MLEITNLPNDHWPYGRITEMGDKGGKKDKEKSKKQKADKDVQKAKAKQSKPSK